MERESENKNILLNRIVLGLNQSREVVDKPAHLNDALQHLRQENDALRKTLRMQNGLRQRFEQLYDSTPIGYLTISGNVNSGARPLYHRTNAGSGIDQCPGACCAVF